MSAISNGRKTTLAQLAGAKCLAVDFLRELGVHDLADGGVGIRYYGTTAEEIAVKRRTALKAKDGSYWPKGTPLAAYGQWRLDAAAKAGFLILAEGESDCWALWRHGLPALGLPGANAAKTLLREHVEGVATIYVHREPDAGGDAFVRGVAARLATLGFRGKAFEICMPDGVKDPGELHAADPDGFKEALVRCIRDATPIPLGSRAAPEPAWESPLPLSAAPAVQDFPVEVFPEALRRFAVDAAAAVGCPVDYLTVPMLAVAGGAIGASKALAIKRQYVQRALLYAAVVGPPGDGKTPALSLVAGPIHEAQQKARALHEQEMAVHEADCAKPKEGGKEKPRKPVLLRVHTDDATVESLAPILMKNPRGLIEIRDELAAWVTSANQYKGGKGSDRQFWLSNWAGVQACVDRKGREEPILIPHPFVAVVGGIQPDVLSVLADPRGRADGFLDRILFAYPDARPAPDWTWDEIPDEVHAPWRQTVQALLDLNMEPGAHGLRPFLVGLTADARPRWQALMDSLTHEMNDPDFPFHLRGPWSKLKVYAARLALILHYIRFVNKEAADQQVDGESVRRAALLVSYFKSHIRKVLAALDADPKAAAAKRVLACLKRNKALDDFTRADLYQLLRGGFKNPEDLDAPLTVLTARQYLGCFTPERPKGSRGANPARYRINPLWDRNGDGEITGITGETRVDGVTPVIPVIPEAANECEQ